MLIPALASALQFLRSCYCISGLIKLMMKMSVIKISPLFSKLKFSADSFNFPVFNSSSQELLCDAENVSVKSDVSCSDERVLYSFPKFGGR